MEFKAVDLATSEPIRVWQLHVAETHARLVLRRHNAPTDLDVWTGPLGPFKLSSVFDGVYWRSSVFAAAERIPLSIAASLAEILGTEGWEIARAPGVFVLRKPLPATAHVSAGRVVLE